MVREVRFCKQSATNTMLINHNPICATFTPIEIEYTNSAEFSMKNTTAVNTESPTLMNKIRTGKDVKVSNLWMYRAKIVKDGLHNCRRRNTKWVEFFSLPNAMARECGITVLEEVFLRYGISRRIISDNGSQFVSAVMQQLRFFPKYPTISHTSPAGQMTKEPKPFLAIYVRDTHDCCPQKLPSIRLALNTSKCPF
ncbi:reverse transcriptase [Caerostris darwini]|uniref:Reverse transcriptase n=1 Tax=Caerostris darwini TaxID=1538125 RepID=A0AAV4TZK5_9ARAC|nr:reverse transcriptase [Caerostris darwini]